MFNSDLAVLSISLLVRWDSLHYHPGTTLTYAYTTQLAHIVGAVGKRMLQRDFI